MKPTNEITISKFKATCLAVPDRVKRTGQPVLVTKHGKPNAIIDPPPPPERNTPWLGSFKSKGRIGGDIVSTAAPDSDWQVFHD